MSKIMKATVLFLVIALNAKKEVASSQPTNAKFVEVPATSEQLQVYRDFLADYLKGSKRVLNLSNKTSAFEADDNESRCLRGFRIPAQPQILHIFPEGFGSDVHIKIADPQTHKIKDPGDSIRKGQTVDDAVEEGFRHGLFSFSEIVFDAKHHRAALQYSFHCGALCGNGQTVILELHNGRWIRSKRVCDAWIS